MLRNISFINNVYLRQNYKLFFLFLCIFCGPYLNAESSITLNRAKSLIFSSNLKEIYLKVTSDNFNKNELKELLKVTRDIPNFYNNKQALKDLILGICSYAFGSSILVLIFGNIIQNIDITYEDLLIDQDSKTYGIPRAVSKADFAVFKSTLPKIMAQFYETKPINLVANFFTSYFIYRAISNALFKKNFLQTFLIQKHLKQQLREL